jgi:hypothetical protein
VIQKTRYKLTKHVDETIEQKHVSKPAQGHITQPCVSAGICIVPLLQYCAVMQSEATLGKHRWFVREAMEAK